MFVSKTKLAAVFATAAFFSLLVTVPCAWATESDQAESAPTSLASANSEGLQDKGQEAGTEASSNLDSATPAAGDSSQPQDVGVGEPGSGQPDSTAHESGESPSASEDDSSQETQPGDVDADLGDEVPAQPEPDGWRSDDKGNRYYIKGGTRLMGEASVDGSRYYFDPAAEGVAKTGWANVPTASGSKRCLFGPDGRMLTGQQRVGGAWYWLDPSSGAMAKGFVWIADQGKWVYCGRDGKMLYGQQQINGRWYLFDRHTGAVTYGFAYIADQRKWVFYDRTMGWMLYGQQYIDGHWYLFDKHTGATTYGFVHIDDQDKWVFYDRTMGWMLYGEQRIDGHWYLLDSWTGAVRYGWQHVDSSGGKWVFYHRVMGWMLYGRVAIDGDWFDFDRVTGSAGDAAHQRWMLDRASGAGGVHFFGGGWADPKDLAALENASSKIRSNGYSLGYIVMDLQTGQGIACDADRTFFAASTVKGPYITSLYKHQYGSRWNAPSAAERGQVFSTVVDSSNGDYDTLYKRYGVAPLRALLSEVGIDPGTARQWRPSTPRELGKLWLRMNEYFHSGDAGGHLKGLYLRTNHSCVRDELGRQYAVATKPGWQAGIPGRNATNDAGIVYAGDRPYLIVVMSDAPDRIDMMRRVVRSLETIHWKWTL